MSNTQRSHVAAAAIALSAAGALLSAADAPGDWCYVGTRGDEFASGQQPPIAIAAASDLAKSPIAAVYTQCRDRPLHYRFAVPDGTYRVRVHWLQASGAGAAKNNAEFVAVANGTTLAADQPMWMPSTWARGGKETEVPADVVAKTAEADVAAADGRILISFPFGKKRQDWGISGIELLGHERQLRVRCGSDQACTGADGTVWEPDAGHYQPTPTSGDFSVAPIASPAGTWVNISDAFFARMGEALALAPLPRPFFSWRVVCDRRGNVLIPVTGLGVWRYDCVTGEAKRVDGGHFAADPCQGVDVNPEGSGACIMGNLALRPDAFGVLSDDGERCASVTRNGGTDFISVDWTASPHVLYAKLHDRNNQTAVSSDGGKTFREFDDNGNATYGGIGAVGNGVLLKCDVDGTLHRSADLGATWDADRTLAFSAPCGCYIQRFDAAVWLHNGAGDCFVSDDLGRTWTPKARTPGFWWPIQRGKDARRLVGFVNDDAYESVDLGEHWSRVIEHGIKQRYDFFGWERWSYDAAHDAFFYVEGNGDIMRYAR